MRLKAFFAFHEKDDTGLVKVSVFDADGELDQRPFEITMTPLEALKAAEDLISAAKMQFRRQEIARSTAEREARREAARKV